MDIRKFLKSFKFAFLGLKNCIKTQQNMRVHLLVGSLICYFAYFFEISKIEWAILLMVIGFVLFAECVNTAVEALGDAVTKEENLNIKIAKDVSAGAVTISAITSLAVGICLFADGEKIVKTVTYIFTHWQTMVDGAVILMVNFMNFWINRKGDK